MANYLIQRTDPNNTPINVIDDQIGQTVPQLDIALIGQNATNYGTAVATTQVHLMENFAASTAPPRPLTGQLWFDDSVKVLQVNVGGDGVLAVWEPVATGSGGEVNDGTNLPVTPIPNSATVFAGKSGVDLQFKSIVGGADIAVTPDASGEFLTISYVGGGSGGEVNDGVNVGSGEPVFKQKVGVDLQFRSITAGSGIEVSTNGDNIQIDNTGGGTGGGEANDGANLGSLVVSPAGSEQGVFWNKNGVVLQFRSLRAGSGISLSGNSEVITITNTGGSGGGGLNAVVEDPAPKLGGDLLTNGNSLVLQDLNGSTVDPTYIWAANVGFGNGLHFGRAVGDNTSYTRYYSFYAGANALFTMSPDGNLSVSPGTTPNSGNDLITRDYADANYQSAGGSSYTRAVLYNNGAGATGTFNLTGSIASYKQIMVEFISKQSGTWYASEFFDRQTIRVGPAYNKSINGGLGDNNGNLNYRWNSNSQMQVIGNSNTNGGGITRVIGINF